MDKNIGSYEEEYKFEKNNLKKYGCCNKNIKRLITVAEEFLYPMQCPVCGELLTYDSQRNLSELKRKKPGFILGMTYKEISDTYSKFMCPNCHTALDPIEKQSCIKCGKGLSRKNIETGICTDCSSRIRMFEKCICVFYYNESARNMAAAFKYNHRKDIIEPLSFALAAKLAAEHIYDKAEVIVPVPVHKNRMKQRGYNQAEAAADYVGYALGLPVLKDILIRNENTAAQNRLSKNQRIRNLRQAFSSGKTEGIKSVLIIDDIYTTGATMEACTEALLNAGVKKVYGACFFAGQDR